MNTKDSNVSMLSASQKRLFKVLDKVDQNSNEGKQLFTELVVHTINEIAFQIELFNRLTGDSLKLEYLVEHSSVIRKKDVQEH